MSINIYDISSPKQLKDYKFSELPAGKHYILANNKEDKLYQKKSANETLVLHNKNAHYNFGDTAPVLHNVKVIPVRLSAIQYIKEEL